MHPPTPCSGPPTSPPRSKYTGRFGSLLSEMFYAQTSKYQASFFLHTFSCNLPFSMLTQGRCAINSEEASSISREKFDIIWRRPSLYYLWLKYLTLQSSMPLHPQPLYNINCTACISEGKTWVQLKVRELTKITRRVTVLSRGLSCTWVWLTWPPSAIWVQFTKYSSWYLLNI